MNHELAATVVEYLDELIKIDPKAMQALVEARVPCGDALSDHPTVQCGIRKDGEGAEVGLIGILNGLCGALEDGYGAVSVIVEQDGTLQGARLLTPEDRGHHEDPLPNAT